MNNEGREDPAKLRQQRDQLLEALMQVGAWLAPIAHAGVPFRKREARRMSNVVQAAIEGQCLTE